MKQKQKEIRKLVENNQKLQDHINKLKNDIKAEVLE